MSVSGAMPGPGRSTWPAGVPAVDAVSASRLADVVPALASRVERLMIALHTVGVPVRVTAGRRTLEEQRRLYAQGRTTPGPIVTWTLASKHLEGRAVDLVWRTRDGVSWDGPWEMLGAMAEELGLRWGGRWSRPDKPHLELPEGTPDED